ncbi:MAG TPA: OmpA family protein [Bacteroidia bacterium]|nr:OmpA family protein [Bacteroidia bacterium]HNT80048.1 OmpA family protein [Bacteroidia bacterium]
MKALISFIALILLWNNNSLCQTTLWATKVLNYSSQKEIREYSTQQALGEPNSMPNKGYSTTAWEAATDDRKEFIQVEFEKAMKASMVIVAENYAPGAVYKISAFDVNGTEYELYRKRPDTLNQISRFLYVKFEKTNYEIASVKVSIDCRAIPGENQIDAIGIADHQNEIISEIKEVQGVEFYSDVERLSNNINSTYTEVNPVISPDGKVLFINRKDFPPHTNDDEIWYSVLDEEGEWGAVKQLGAPLNNSNHNFVNSITPDGNVMLLGNQYFKDSPDSYGSGFSISKKAKDGWGFPENALIKNFVNKDRYVNFYMSNDAKKVFMNIRAEDTRGTSDLYVSFLQKDGSWSQPKNLGTTINSTGSECCAFLAADNQTLYFASDGHNGYGSSDIFMSRRLDDSFTKWSEPLNMGKVLNSNQWDAYYTIPASGEYAYFVRNSDIYRVRLTPEQKPLPVFLVRGKVLDRKNSNPIPNAKIYYEYLIDGIEAGTAASSVEDGTYTIVLPFGHRYGFMASAINYLSISDHIDATQLKEYTEINRDLYLVPAEVGQTIRLNNIFFDFAKATLRKESEPELNRIVDFLKQNSSIEISLSGHTDDVGNDDANLQLSIQRAAAVKEYLVQSGINENRLSSQGFGEQNPVASNDTEEGRQLNRRVEFTILKK